MRRAALYIRVSTDRQHAENQRPDLESLAARRGLEVVRVYDETLSAAKSRPVFDAMKRDAKRGAFDVLLVWRLDRFGRSMAGNIADVLELDRAGVAVVSAHEEWLDSGGPTRSLLLAIFSWVAEQERLTLIDRTKAGLARARREGKTIGRPRVSPVMVRAAMDAVRHGAQSVSAASRTYGIARPTLRRYLAKNPA